MKKILIYLAGAAILFSGCAKVAENDVPAPVKIDYPSGMTFTANLGAFSKSYFGDEENNPGQLYWSETDKVAIYGVPITGTRDGGGDSCPDFIFNWSDVRKALATVEVLPDATQALLHTWMSMDDWKKGTTQMMFFAIYPATEIPEIYTDTGRNEIYFFPSIKTEQNGVDFGDAQILCSATLACNSNEMTDGVPFRPFTPGTTVLAFNVKNATDQPLEISTLKIVAQYDPSEPIGLSGECGLYIDFSSEYSQDIGPEAEIGCSDPGDDGYDYVNVNFENPITIAPGATTSGRYYAAISSVGIRESDLDAAYLRFEALDGEGNVLAAAERAFPADDTGNHFGLEKGHRYNLSVVLEEETGYHFMVVKQPEIVNDFTGGTTTGLIRSYKVINGETSYVSWTLDGVFNDLACTEAANPSILKGSVEPVNVDLSKPSAAFIIDIERRMNRNKWLVTSEAYTPTWREAKGTETSAYNLSSPYGDDTIYNTANCYVINGPGYYKFPCVLGNGIKDGAPNPGAWMATDNAEASGRINYLAVLRDYCDQNIVSPYVHSSSAEAATHTPTSACVIWEDAEDLIDADASYLLSAPAADANGIYWIQFHIGENTLSQGNAVIAVKDENGDVMWSWHIWVTPFGFGSDYSDIISFDWGENESLNAAPVNLGFVEQRRLVSIDLAEDVLYLRLKQDESGKTVIAKVRQSGDSYVAGSENIPAKGYSPLWQYGRKDPIMPGDPDTITNLPCWGTNPTLVVETFTKAATTEASVPVSLSIRHPEKLIFACENEEKERYSFTYMVVNNAWNMLASFGNKHLAEQNIPQRKSVYDPSPVGYQVPQPYDLQHFNWSPGDDESKSIVQGWKDVTVVEQPEENGLFIFGQGRLRQGSSLSFFPYTGGRQFRYGGAIAPVLFQEGMSYNKVGVGLANNQDDDNVCGEWWFYCTTSYDEDADEFNPAGDDFAVVMTETTMHPLAGTAGFIRPVADRSTTFTPPSTPIFGGGNGAGSYTDINW